MLRRTDNHDPRTREIGLTMTSADAALFVRML
jgi:hypothetical protein